MGSTLSTLAFYAKVVKSALAYTIFGWNKEAYSGDSLKNGSDISKSIPVPTFLSNTSIVAALTKLMKENGNSDKLPDDALVKIFRQLDHFYKEEKLVDEQEIVSLAQSLVDQSVWYHPLVNKSVSVSPDSQIYKSKVPTVRFGKTELNISILTCGGMRFQNSWVPDSIPILSPNREQVLKSPPQKNIKDCIRYCMALGMNHFETARMYGTSEYQITEALYELMEEGEIKREDFIFQTKIAADNTKNFMKLWDATWKNVGEKLGYIDLFSLHAIADINEKLEQSLAICNDLKKEGKIKHIGFSTHGSSEQIMNVINTEHFAYINIHEHYFGSYHGSGTPDTMGGQGNLACVKRALELDMGIFLISPVDKGGKLHRPSKDCVSLVGKELTPIGFALLYGWKTNGFHTASIGLARPSDLDEVLGAAKMMALSNNGGKNITDDLLKKATDRLDERAVQKLGKEWVEKGLLNLPSFLDEPTDGIAVGHILWLYNLIVSYGMYEFCRDRYNSNIDTGTKWDKKKSFKENADAMSRGNMGRSYDENVDLTKALENHFDPSLALDRIRQTHEWLKEPMSDEELANRGWKKGYNLTVWEEMPGELDSRALLYTRVMLQTFTGGRMGVVETGPGDSIKAEASQIRDILS